MYDYSEITKQLCKDKINLIHLDWQGENKSGTFYSINGIHQMKVFHNEEANSLKITGSIPYFVNGHNFYTSNEDYFRGIQYMEDLLHVQLSNAIVDCFEFGKIVEVAFPAITVIMNHNAPKGMKPSYYSNGRYFEDSLHLIKFYNAKENIFRKLDSAMQKKIEGMGFDRKKEWVKVEVKHKKPHITLNKGLGVLVADLTNPYFQRKIEDNFLNQYNRLMITKTVKIPDSKKELSAGSIILMSLAEVALNMGKTAKELIYGKLKEIPESVLNSNDKKARQAQFRKMLKAIEANENSKYDLTDLLKEQMQYATA